MGGKGMLQEGNNVNESEETKKDLLDDQVVKNEEIQKSDNIITQNIPKKKSKKLFVGLIVLFIVAIFVGCISLFKNKNISESSSDVLFADGRVDFKEGEKYGFLDSNGKEIISAEYESVGRFCEGLVAVKKDGKYGYINKNNKLVIDYKYDEAGPFKDGYAIVSIGNKKGVIDKKGKTIIDINYYKISYLLDDMFRIVKEKKDDSEEDDVIGEEESYIYDSKGKCVTDNTFYLDGVAKFSEGLLAVKNKNDKYGYINKKGEYVIDAKFENANDFNEGLAAVRVNKENNEKEDESEDLSVYGFIDKFGKFIIEPQYDYTYGFCEGLACVRKDSKYGYINKKGELEIQLEYDDAHRFTNGKSIVGYRNTKKDNGDMLYGVINKNDKQVIPVEYDEIECCGSIYTCKNSDGYVFLDDNGKRIIDKEYNEASVMYEDGFAVVANDNKKYVIIDKKGNQITEKEYEEIFIYDSSIFCIQDNCFESSWYESEKGYCKKHYEELEAFQDPYELTWTMWTYEETYGGGYLILSFYSDGKGRITTKDYSDTDISWEYNSNDDKIIITTKTGGNLGEIKNISEHYLDYIINGQVYLLKKYED